MTKHIRSRDHVVALLHHRPCHNQKYYSNLPVSHAWAPGPYLCLDVDEASPPLDVIRTSSYDGRSHS